MIDRLKVWVRDSRVKRQWSRISESVADAQATRDAATESIQPLVARINEVLVRHDPIGLIGMGAPPDEYYAEAQTIAIRLSDHAGVLTTEIAVGISHEEFTKWFGSGTAGPRDHYGPIGEEVHESWVSEKSGPD